MWSIPRAGGAFSMTFMKKTQKTRKIPLAWLGGKNKTSTQSPTYTKQSYTQFQRQSVQKSSPVRKTLRKAVSFFTNLRKTSRSGDDPRKIGYRLVVAMLCLVVVIGAGALLFNERSLVAALFSKVEYFEVGNNVVIDGCHVTTPAEIRELGEIRYHTNLFSINPIRLAAILDRHPWIKKAVIHRDWPNKLVIDISEHVPEALAVMGAPGQEQFYYVDAKGVPFISAKPGQDFDFPVITGMDRLKADRRREVLHDAMQFIELVKRNNPNLPAQSISEVHLDSTEGMIVYLVEYPFPIYFGVGEVRKKYKQLEDVLEVLYKQRKEGMLISQVEYIRMDYSENKVLVAQSRSS